MTHPAPIYTTLADWIAHEAIPFSVDSSETFHAAADKTITFLFRFGGVAWFWGGTTQWGRHSHPSQPAIRATGCSAWLQCYRHREQFALNAESFTDFDCLAFFDSTDYARGGWPLEGLSACPKQ